MTLLGIQHCVWAACTFFCVSVFEVTQNLGQIRDSKHGGTSATQNWLFGVTPLTQWTKMYIVCLCVFMKVLVMLHMPPRDGR